MDRRSREIRIAIREALPPRGESRPLPLGGTSADARRALYAHLHTFPFWMYVDLRSPPEIVDVEIQGRRFCIYPPFRSGSANHLALPEVDTSQVPYRPEAKKRLDPRNQVPGVAAVPVLGVDAAGKMSLQTMWEKAWRGFPGNQLPMDSIRVDVDEPPVSPFVAEIIAAILRSLRIRSKQWWITRSSAPFSGFMRVGFLCNEVGEPRGNPGGFAKGLTVSPREQLIDSAIWRQSIEDAVTGTEFPESRHLFLDAEYFAADNDIRAALMALSCALEVEIEDFCHQKWMAQTAGQSAFKRSRVMRGDGLPDYLSDDLERLIRRSLKDEDPATFASIESIWLARGSVAHGGPAEFYLQGARTAVDQGVIMNFIAIGRRCLEWLQTL